MAKRKIKPHKGGRDNNLSMRIATDEKERLKAIADAMNMSIVDYIMTCVQRDEKNLEKTN